MASEAGGSVCVNASLITTPGRAGADGSFWPGEPPIPVLTRQFPGRPQFDVGALSLTDTKENPRPSAAGYHLSSNEKSRIGSWLPPERTRWSPALFRFPEKVPR